MSIYTFTREITIEKNIDYIRTTEFTGTGIDRKVDINGAKSACSISCLCSKDIFIVSAS